MPAISFEKISPMDRRGQPPFRQSLSRQSLPSGQPLEEKRSVIVQVLGRFVDVRVKRGERVDQATLERRPKDLPK